MPDRKIKNISSLPNPLSVQIRNPEGGKDVIVLLGNNEEFWSPNNLDTNSTTIYSRKGFISMTDEKKPDGANYYETYPSDYWATKKLNNEEAVYEIVAEIVKKEEAQDDGVMQRKKWEDSDIAFLKKHYPKNGVLYCAEKLGRTKNSVKKKVEALGLKKADA